MPTTVSHLPGCGGSGGCAAAVPGVGNAGSEYRRRRLPRAGSPGQTRAAKSLVTMIES
jgi:hypothetical protein